MEHTISRRTIARALLYIRTLKHLIKYKRHLVSSRELAEITGLSDVLIRKDISSFGKVGTPRLGYETKELRKVLENFILNKKQVRAVLFGYESVADAMGNESPCC